MKPKSIYTDLIAIDCKKLLGNFLSTSYYTDRAYRLSRDIYDRFEDDEEEEEEEL